MKKGIYGTLAVMGMQKNQKLYLPYLLTCMGSVMMCYIMSVLSISPILNGMKGGNSMQMILSYGFGVMGIFSAIFLFYTNSFLIRRRKKEFGLYNILGLGKKHLALVLLGEMLIIAAITIVGGLFFGILLSKFAELCLVKILGGTAGFEFYIGSQSMINTVVIFGIIFGIIYLNTLRQIHLSNPIQLLHSENVGEKPPKANWLLAILGVMILAAAYYMALTIQDPFTALAGFFVAVVMVIVATYLLFIAGSVVLCKILQKNKNYYYKPQHFVSVSTMVYRMKRNGAGLASICILCTMVLVMVSSTTCLYIGMEDCLRTRYPRNINMTVYVSDVELMNEEKNGELRNIVEQTVAEYGAEQENILQYRCASFLGYLNERQIIYDNDKVNASVNGVDMVFQIFVVPLSDYNMLMGTSEELSAKEAILYTTKGIQYVGDTIQLDGGESFQVVKQAESFVDNGVDAMQIVPSMYLFVPDIKAFLEPIADLDELLDLEILYGFDLSCEDSVQLQIQNRIMERVSAMGKQVGENAYFHILTESIASGRADFYGLYGGLFFLGILLGIVFVAATVLIIYYKQVSEGYEDQARFAIMQKVGMTKGEIQKSINSQVLIVFSLPLLTAGIHLMFAFPLIARLLQMFNLNNTGLLVSTTVCCFVIFAVLYALVYRMTSKSYFTIVSGIQED